MNAPPSGARPGETAPVYIEPARSYATPMLLLGGLGIGLVIDVVAGGALVHLVGWLIAIVVVVGLSAWTTHTARRLRSITVTADDVHVGQSALARASIVALGPTVPPTAPVLGQPLHQGLPRGVPGLAVQLRDGGAMVIPTRYPDRLAAVLHLGSAVRGVPEIRPADPADLPELPDIERRAETLFQVTGVDLPDLPIPVDALNEARCILVAGRPAVGFVRIDEVDDMAHIVIVAVLPGAMRRGVGSALLEAACDWAKSAGYRTITVITYADVAWNAPFYFARGFRETTQLTPALAELRDWERAVGLDAAGRRIVLRREL